MTAKNIKVMKKRIFYIIFFLAIMVSGCSKSVYQINISDFQHTEEGYCFRGIIWGSSVQEVEKILEVKLEEAKEASSGTYKILQDGKVKFLDAEGEMYFYFKEGALEDLSFQASGNESLEMLYEKASEEFARSFGSSSDVFENTGPYAGMEVNTIIQRWDAEDDTSLQVILGKGENQKYSIVVGILKSM